MNLTKTILPVVVFLSATITLFSANITIIESQSIHPLHNMDENWQNIATNLGYNATISPQQFLDDINNLNNTDVLIISSGLINLPANRQQTIKQFVEDGGNLYIQAEYLINLPGNQAFSYLINNLGGSFSWDGELTGSLAPMYVIGDLSENLNSVAELTYFWYGTHGSGDATIHSILKYNNLDWGFIFCPVDLTYGKIITTSDQDWVRTLNSEALMANILNYLVTHMPLSTLPTVSIDYTEEGPCNDPTYTFNATIENYMGGSNLQWMVNGVNVAGETDSVFVSSDLVDGDVVECQLFLSTFCTSYTHISNPILIAPINSLSNTTLEIVSNGNTFCENEQVAFEAITAGLENATNITYQWTINGLPVASATSTNFETSNLNDQDSVNCIVTFDDICFANNTLTSNPIILTIMPASNPTATLLADQTSICEGETITFTIEGSDLGNDPTYQWQIDGSNTGNNSPIFTTNTLTTGQNITCTITTNQTCAVANSITTNTITVDVLQLITPSINISPNATEICPGEEVTFTASGYNFGNEPSFQWQIDGVNVGANIPEFTTNQLTNGQIVTCILTADLACSQNNIAESAPMSITIIESVNPSISIQSSASIICKGQEVTFTAFSNNHGNNPVFEWMVDGIPVPNSDSIFKTTSITNAQVVTCQITNPDACEAFSTALSNAITMTVNEVDVEVLEIGFENCGNADGIIEIEGIGGTEPYSYEWMNGANENLLTGLSYGKFTVTVTDAVGCSSIGQIEMSANESPEVSNALINIADCDGDNGSAQLILSDTTMSYTFEWLNENGTVVSYADHATNLQTGSYSINISNEFGCQTTETIFIDQVPAINVFIGNDIQLDLGESFQLQTIVNTLGGVTYDWAQVEGISCTTCPKPTVFPSESTIYNVTVTNEYGCTSTDEIIVRVMPRRDIFIPNAFTPNNDGINDFFTVFAGENVNSIKSMQIFDRWGEVIFSKTDFAPNNEPDGWNGYAKGKKLQSGVYVYMIEVEYMDGKTKLHKGDVSITRQ